VLSWSPVKSRWTILLLLPPFCSSLRVPSPRTSLPRATSPVARSYLSLTETCWPPSYPFTVDYPCILTTPHQRLLGRPCAVKRLNRCPETHSIVLHCCGCFSWPRCAQGLRAYADTHTSYQHPPSAPAATSRLSCSQSILCRRWRCRQPAARYTTLFVGWVWVRVTVLLSASSLHRSTNHIFQSVLLQASTKPKRGKMGSRIVYATADCIATAPGLLRRRWAASRPQSKSMGWPVARTGPPLRHTCPAPSLTIHSPYTPSRWMHSILAQYSLLTVLISITQHKKWWRAVGDEPCTDTCARGRNRRCSHRPCCRGRTCSASAASPYSSSRTKRWIRGDSATPTLSSGFEWLNIGTSTPIHHKPPTIQVMCANLWAAWRRPGGSVVGSPTPAAHTHRRAQG